MGATRAGGMPEAVAVAIEGLLGEVDRELCAAIAKHGPIRSPHEGYAVIAEELDELWDHVKADTGTGPEARREALQIAAVALRYALDVSEP